MDVAVKSRKSEAEVKDLPQSQRRRVIGAAFLGTTIEFYDFTLYGLMGPIVFGELFFPKSDPTTALIAVLSIYAVGFFGRPLGGLVFSHFGDRFGRKPMMILSMGVMGIASTLMGLLPTYDTLGVWAAVLLLALRTVQGFALGGESAGANVLSVEVAPHGRRGFMSSLVTTGIFAGWILAIVASTLVSYLSRPDMLAWGWRLPFLASFLLVITGIWMRFKTEESSVFVNAVSSKGVAKIPVVELFRSYRKPLAIVAAVSVAESATGFFFLVFGYSYAVSKLHVAPPVILQSMLAANIIGILFVPMVGKFSDRMGRRVAFLIYFISGLIFTAFAFFPMLASGNTALIYAALIIPIGLLSPFLMGVSGSFHSEQFTDARVRYTGVGVGRGLGTALGAGLTPVISTSLMAMTNGTSVGPIWWYSFCSALGIFAVCLARETKDEKLT